MGYNSTVRRFAFTEKELSNGKKILWSFYYEDRHYDTYVDLNKYENYKNGTGGSWGFLYDGYEVLNRYIHHISIIEIVLKKNL